MFYPLPFFPHALYPPECPIIILWFLVMLLVLSHSSPVYIAKKSLCIVLYSVLNQML